MPARRVLAAAMIAAGCALVLAPATRAHAAAAGHCGNQGAIAVPGAQKQVVTCLSDMSATSLIAQGRTDYTDWEALSSKKTVNPAAGPGIQVDGYFPDDSTTNGEFGWNHDAQFVIRLPDKWNGKLVVTGAPGVRKQFADDFIISDFVLARGYAYASTDKGNTGVTFFDNGSSSAPGQAIQEWHQRVTQLALAAKKVVAQRYGVAPRRTYMTGISNGGYLTRWQLEKHPGLYDGGTDWEGTLFRADGPNLFTYLPTAIKNYAAWKAGSQAAHDAIIKAGFASGSEFLWDYHEANYWDLTQRTYREVFDPGYDGPTQAGTPFCQTGTVPGTPTACDADYNYASRPQAVKDAVGSVSLTGRLGKPMLTLHGDLDALLPIRTDSDVYDQMVRQAGSGALHHYYRIGAGNHVDSLYDTYPSQLRPILPCYRNAFLDMELQVERGIAPPTDRFVPKPASGDVVNSCPALAPRTGGVSAANPAGPPLPPASSPATTAGAGSAGGGSAGSATPTSVARATSGRATPPRATLAFTGSSPAAALGGVLLLAAAGLLGRRRQQGH